MRMSRMSSSAKVFDSFAWIEYFKGGGRAKRVKEYVDGRTPIYTPSICLTEIAFKYLREGKESKERIEFILDRSYIIETSASMALDAAAVKQRDALHTVDAIVYASSRSKQKVLVTGDEHFKNLPSVEMI
ncbi:MAG: type II toxin-antitoxin system VapC family toxin [Candidatus Verstraetearchaeota archaeon]|nr:type II toxin-antitoxin system VapC family toxin [Candidatus Verstraetearchaeota archaeon]